MARYTKILRPGGLSPRRNELSSALELTDNESVVSPIRQNAAAGGRHGQEERKERAEKELGHDTLYHWLYVLSVPLQPDQILQALVSFPVSPGTLAFARRPPKNAGKTKSGRRVQKGCAHSAEQ